MSAAAAGAQQPTQQQVQQALQNPDILAKIQQRIQSSGLSPDQIRAKLQAAGYPSTLLDSYLSSGTPSAAGALPSDQILQVLNTLVPPPQTPAGTSALPVDTGVVRRDSTVAQKPDSALELFGADVFRGSRTQFQPLLTGPVPSSYEVGAGDVLALVITGEVELAYSLEVTRDGFVVIPQVGQIYVNGLTMDELRRILGRRLAQAYSGIGRGTTKFNLTLASLRTNQIYVVGAVAQPGAYQLSSVATVLNALYAAGGPTDQATFRNVLVRRQGEIVAHLDLYDYLLEGDTRSDVVLRQGDVVFVPVHGPRVSINGAVIRPAVYELKPGQTLTDLVSAAGGFRPVAALKRIQVQRIVPPSQRLSGGPDRIVIDVAGSQTQADKAPPFPLEAGDRVEVFEIPDATKAVVELKGAVYHPGTYGWRAGIRLSDLVHEAGGLQPAVYAGAAHIERLNPIDSTRFLVRVPLPADSAKPFPDDIALQDFDVVTIYSRESFREDRYVTISGMVNNPGRYPYRAGMTLKDLAVMAHGLRDGAYLDSAELARLPNDRSSGRLANTFRVPLDSSYLLGDESSTYPLLPGLKAATKSAPDVPLEPEDAVLILKQPEFELQRKVILAGEVKFPGVYVIVRKDERVSDLIRRAGGFLSTAYPEGTQFIRTVGGAGRINVDIADAVKHPSGDADVILQPGDSIAVPEYTPTVRVDGAVTGPTSVVYRPGAGLDYYIANAGGFSRNADKSRISVHYANGSAQVETKFLFISRDPEPKPGSVIFVPAKPDEEPFKSTEFLGSLAQVLASVIAIVVVVTRK